MRWPTAESGIDIAIYLCLENIRRADDLIRVFRRIADCHTSYARQVPFPPQSAVVRRKLYQNSNRYDCQGASKLLRWTRRGVHLSHRGPLAARLALKDHGRTQAGDQGQGQDLAALASRRGQHRRSGQWRNHLT
jgi:hypothetical protein